MADAILMNHGGGIRFKELKVVTPPTKTEYVYHGGVGELVNMAGSKIAAQLGGTTLAITDEGYIVSPQRVSPSTEAITLTSTISGSTRTASIPITVYTLNSTLENNSWAAIAAASRAGVASSIWSVGATKTATINGATYTFRIIDFDHDALDSTDASADDETYNPSAYDAAAGTRYAGITFQSTTAMGRAKMATSTGSNANQWALCHMRTVVLPELLNAFPAEMQSAMKVIAKQTCKGTSSASAADILVPTADKLFLAGVYEIYANPSTRIAPSIEASVSSQYAYYATAASPAKGSYDEWLRSPHWPVNCEGNHFCLIKTDGTLTATGHECNEALDYYPVFCV